MIESADDLVYVEKDEAKRVRVDGGVLPVRDQKRKMRGADEVVMAEAFFERCRKATTGVLDGVFRMINGAVAYVKSYANSMSSYYTSDGTWWKWQSTSYKAGRRELFGGIVDRIVGWSLSSVEGVTWLDATLDDQAAVPTGLIYEWRSDSTIEETNEANRAAGEFMEGISARREALRVARNGRKTAAGNTKTGAYSTAVENWKTLCDEATARYDEALDEADAAKAEAQKAAKDEYDGKLGQDGGGSYENRLIWMSAKEEYDMAMDAISHKYDADRRKAESDKNDAFRSAEEYFQSACREIKDAYDAEVKAADEEYDEGYDQTVHDKWGYLSEHMGDLEGTLDSYKETGLVQVEDLYAYRKSLKKAYITEARLSKNRTRKVMVFRHTSYMSVMYIVNGNDGNLIERSFADLERAKDVYLGDGALIVRRKAYEEQYGSEQDLSWYHPETDGEDWTSTGERLASHSVTMGFDGESWVKRSENKSKVSDAVYSVFYGTREEADGMTPKSVTAVARVCLVGSDTESKADAREALQDAFKEKVDSIFGKKLEWPYGVDPVLYAGNMSASGTKSQAEDTQKAIAEYNEASAADDLKDKSWEIRKEWFVPITLDEVEVNAETYVKRIDKIRDDVEEADRKSAKEYEKELKKLEEARDEEIRAAIEAHERYCDGRAATRDTEKAKACGDYLKSLDGAMRAANDAMAQTYDVDEQREIRDSFFDEKMSAFEAKWKKTNDEDKSCDDDIDTNRKDVYEEAVKKAKADYSAAKAELDEEYKQEIKDNHADIEEMVNEIYKERKLAAKDVNRDTETGEYVDIIREGNRLRMSGKLNWSKDMLDEPTQKQNLSWWRELLVLEISDVVVHYEPNSLTGMSLEPYAEELGYGQDG